MRRHLACLTVFSCLLAWSVTAFAASPLLVFAAASTTNAIQKIDKAFTQKTGIPVTASFASSGTLAKQIVNGAPAGVFLSANVKWMNYLDQKGQLAPSTRGDLLRNRLVLVAPVASPLSKVKIGPKSDVSKLLAGGWLAMGDPAHVPAGSYAKESLGKLGWWPKLQGHLALAANVRAALLLVERGEANLGVVYATDARITNKVKVVGVFPAESHRPIVYPVALVKGQATPAAQSYLKFLRGPQAKAIFASYGFEAF
jgi:molybdate transport system substrate-binding protein